MSAHNPRFQQMNLHKAKALYPELRELSGLASDEWCESFDTKTGRAEICTRDRRSGIVEPIAAILPDCSYDDRMLMQKAPTYILALLILLDEAFRRLKELQPKPEKAPNFAAECAMKCKDDHLFRKSCTNATAPTPPIWSGSRRAPAASSASSPWPNSTQTKTPASAGCRCGRNLKYGGSGSDGTIDCQAIRSAPPGCRRQARWCSRRDRDQRYDYPPVARSCTTSC